MRNRTRNHALMAVSVAVTALLSACSSGGTVTTLDADPMVDVGLPNQLIDAANVVNENLSPTIVLSTGASVSLQRIQDNDWSGVINVTPGSQFTATVTWRENIDGQELPLAFLERSIEVTSDGAVIELSTTEYQTTFDTDSDGMTNLQERIDETDPFNPPDQINETNGDSESGSSNAPAPVNNDQTTQPNTPVTNDDANPGSGVISDQNTTVVAGQSGGTNEGSSEPESDNNSGSNSTNGTTTSTSSSSSTSSSNGSDGSTSTASSNAASAGTNTSTSTSTTTSSDGSTNTASSNATSAGTNTSTNTSTTTSSDGSTNTASSNATSSGTNTSTGSTTGSNTIANSDTTDTEADADTINSEPAIADAIVPRIASSAAPIIDGQGVTTNSSNNFTGEWAAAVQFDNSGAELLIENLIIDVNAEARGNVPFRRWAAMHDGTYLYLVVLVDDNGDRHRDSPSDLINDDSLELFIDGDNSKSTQYDDNDFHRIFPLRLSAADKRSVSSGDIAGPNSSLADPGITFATGPGAGPAGLRRARWEQDVYELKIELDAVGIDADEAFGFELQINDDDEGDERESKWAWKLGPRGSTDIDDTKDNPSLMGTLKLE